MTALSTLEAPSLAACAVPRVLLHSLVTASAEDIAYFSIYGLMHLWFLWSTSSASYFEVLEVFHLRT
jgi:hypothetical protein